MDEESNDNVFRPSVFKGGKEDDDAIPQNDYVVVDADDQQYDVNGFLIFTPHHLAIMTDQGKGAIPALVLPIGQVKVAVLASVIDENEGEQELF